MLGRVYACPQPKDKSRELTPGPSSSSQRAHRTSPSAAMLIIHVQVRVLGNHVVDFIDATRANAAASLKEPGVARFDVVQDLEDPTRFILVEAYRDNDAPARHKETAHYLTWRDAVAPWMAEPRRSTKFVEIYPSASQW